MSRKGWIGSDVFGDGDPAGLDVAENVPARGQVLKPRVGHSGDVARTGAGTIQRQLSRR